MIRLLALFTAFGSACYLVGRERGRTELHRELAREEAAFRAVMTHWPSIDETDEAGA